MSHAIGVFLTQRERPARSASPINAFDSQPGGGDGYKCGRICWRGVFARQEAGEFTACQPLDIMIKSASPKHGGKCASLGYLQIKYVGGGNFGVHTDERAKAGWLILLEVTGGSGMRKSTARMPRASTCASAHREPTAVPFNAATPRTKSSRSPRAVSPCSRSGAR